MSVADELELQQLWLKVANSAKNTVATVDWKDELRRWVERYKSHGDVQDIVDLVTLTVDIRIQHKISELSIMVQPFAGSIRDLVKRELSETIHNLLGGGAALQDL